VNFTDPTGYDVDCASGEGRCRQEIIKVKIEQIQSEYHVEIDQSHGNWSVSKLQAVQNGMDALEKQMGSDQFIEQFSGTTFSVEANRTKSSGVMYTWGHKDVVLGIDVSSEGYIMHETVHELAHIWDNNCGNCKSDGMTMLTGSYTTVQKNLFGTVQKTYNASGKTPTSYAMKNSLEDWAESVTAVIFPDYASTNPWDERRKDFVKGNLDSDLRRTK
jgi:hypothetical protein